MDNYQAKGYAAKALRDLGYGRTEIIKILEQMDYEFDMFSEYEAEQFYYNIGKIK